MAETMENNVIANSDQSAGTAQTTPSGTSFIVGIDMTLLNADFKALVQREAPVDPQEYDSATRILVMPTDEPKGGMSIGEMIQAVNSMIARFSNKQSADLKADDVKKSVGDLVSNDSKSLLDQIYFEILQLFIYYENKTKGGKDVSKNFEFAVSLRITNKMDLPPEFKKLIDLKSITFSIWKTTRKSILNRMALGDIPSLLAG